MAILPEVYSPKIGPHAIIGQKYDTIQRDKFTGALSDFLLPTSLGLNTGLRTGAHILAGFEATRVADFNVSQIDNEIKQLGLFSELDLNQFNRAATKLQGQQKTAIASSGFAFSGSMVDIMADTQAQIELERLSKREVTKAQFQAKRAEQQLQKRKGEQAQLGSFLSAGAEAATGIQSLLEIL